MIEINPGCRRNRFAVGAVCLSLAVLWASRLTAEDVKKAAASRPKTTRKPLTFEIDVSPILNARCFKCHGSKVRKAGLDLRRRFTLLKGGDSGAAIVPGNVDESLLMQMISSGDMPPEGEARLDAEQIGILKRWLATGAAIEGEKEAALDSSDVDSQIT